MGLKPSPPEPTHGLTSLYFGFSVLINSLTNHYFKINCKHLS